jgi:hypothetical protein
MVVVGTRRLTAKGNDEEEEEIGDCVRVSLKNKCCI